MASRGNEGEPLSRRLRIAFTAPRYHTNQVHAVQALQDRGCEVGYFVLYVGPTEDHTLLKPVVLGDGIGFRMARALLRRTGRLLPEHERDFLIAWGCPPLRACWSTLRSFCPDVVIARASALPHFLLSLLFTRLLGKQSIVYTLGPRYVVAGWWKRYLGQLLTTVFRCEWITHVEGDRRIGDPWNRHVHYVPLPIKAAPLPARPHRDPATPLRIMCVGKFTERKNLRLMVDAFQRAGAESQAHLTIVGECSSVGHERYLESLKGHIEELALAESVTVLVNVPFGRMKELYRQHDVFVLPSKDEPLGVVILEAMSYGLPVICSDTAGVMWYIEQGGNGYVFRSDDVEDLALALGRILETPGCVERMGRRSLDLVTSQYSPECYYQSLMAVIEESTRAKHA